MNEREMFLKHLEAKALGYYLQLRGMGASMQEAHTFVTLNEKIKLLEELMEDVRTGKYVIHTAPVHEGDHECG